MRSQLRKSPVWKLAFYFVGLFSLFAFSEIVLADATLGDLAANVTKSVDNFTKLITAAAYVAGVGFGLAGMVKFKAHPHKRL